MTMIRWSRASGQTSFRAGITAATRVPGIVRDDLVPDARARWLAVVRQVGGRLGVCGTGAWIGAGPFAGVLYA